MFSLYKSFINALFNYFSIYNPIWDIILWSVNIEVRELLSKIVVFKVLISTIYCFSDS